VRGPLRGTGKNPVQSIVTDLQCKFDAFDSSTSARMDQLSTVCCTSLDARSGPEPNRNNDQLVTVDRETNIVLFGVPEYRNASIWCHSVHNILNFVFGYSVGSIDMFRLGKFSSLNCRPVLVKPRSENCVG
jgi:hypothetical protein